MPLWFINPSRKRKMKKNPYGKCPKCHVVLTPSGRVCAFCRGKALKKNPFTTSARKLQARRQARWLATGGKLDSLWESEKERSRKARKKQAYKKRKTLKKNPKSQDWRNTRRRKFWKEQLAKKALIILKRKRDKTGKFNKNPHKKGKSMQRQRSRGKGATLSKEYRKWKKTLKKLSPEARIQKRWDRIYASYPKENPYKKGKSMKRRRPSLKRLIARAKARLYGAARKQRIKGLRKKYRKNPWVGRGKNRRWQKRGGLDLAIRLAARAQREAVRKHGYSPSAKRAVTRFKKKAAKAYKKRLAAWRRQSRAMAPKRRPARKSPKRKAVKRARRKAVSRVSKSRKRSLAGKKAARTRARKKAARRAAGRKAARKRNRKSGGRKMARRKFRRLKHGRRTKKRHGRGVRALARSRRSIKYSRRHGSGAARRYLKRYRMRSNPIAMLKDIASNVLPLAAAFFGARFVSSKVPGLPVVGPLLGNLGSGAPVAVAGAVAIGAHFLTKKVSALAKYRSAIMSGAGLNVLFTAIDAFAPLSIKNLLGMGDDGVYDEALGAYSADVAGYEEVNGYEEVSGYEETGASEELGAEEELGGVFSEGAAVGAAARLKALPARSMVRDVPGWGGGNMYTGVFAGGGKGWGGY